MKRKIALLLILVAAACGSVPPATPDASTSCVLGSSQIGHCTLAH